MKTERWYVLERPPEDEGRRPYVWPEGTRQMWRSHLKERVGCGIRRFFKWARRDLERIEPSPAIFVFFPKDCDMSGHLASIRKVWENMLLFNYGCARAKKSSRPPGTYVGTGAVAIWTKHVLRKLADQSPLFAPIWADLKDLPPGECGIYLADEPSAAWLQSIRPDEARLYAEFGEARHLDMMGLDLKKPAEEVIERHLEVYSLQAEDRLGEAETLLEGLLARWPGFWRGYLDLATCALAQDDPKKAYAVIRRAQHQFPDCLNFDRVGVDCCMQLEDWRRAEWHLKRLWGLNPWDPNLKRRYAAVAFGQNDHALAVKLYEECAEQAPLSKNMRINLAVALAKTGRIPAALALFKELEKEGTPSALLLNNVGFLLVGAGRPLEGLDYCRRAVALRPKWESAWDSLGFAHLTIGNFPEAAKALLKAIELSPAFPDAWRHLLHAYQRGGDLERLEGAKAYVRRVLPAQLARFEKELGAELRE